MLYEETPLKKKKINFMLTENLFVFTTESE